MTKTLDVINTNFTGLTLCAMLKVNQFKTSYVCVDQCAV